MLVLISQGDVAFRLIISFLLGGLVGLERESHNKSAGFRTHILVCLGSTLIMLISIYGMSGGTVRDPARLAAQVVSGIGFLGAGTILREGNSVRGLTTAASIWVVSGIGLAVGAGFYLGAIITTGISFLTLITLGHLEKKIIHRPQCQYLILQVTEAPGQIGKVGNVLGKYGIMIKNLDIDSLGTDSSRLQLRILVKFPLGFRLEQVLSELVETEGVYSIEVED